jgi:cysteine desulfurase
VSSGSACSSGAAQPSHVLTAIGEDPVRTALLRISLGRSTTSAEVARASALIVAALGRAVDAPAPVVAGERAGVHRSG